MFEFIIEQRIDICLLIIILYLIIITYHIKDHISTQIYLISTNKKLLKKIEILKNDNHHMMTNLNMLNKIINKS